MRIERLELTAFGPFTNESLEFNGEGLHLVYGPNEAGKSSALRALHDALFGIPGQTSDNFVHDYKEMRIGMRLRDRAGGELAFIRRKGNKETLLDSATGKPLSDSPLRALLGQLDRDTFAQMFGLDYERLVAGGRGITQFEGEIGQLLFSAASGMGDVRAVLRRLDEQAEALYRPRASKNPLNAHLREYEDARKKAKESRVPSRDYQELTAKRERLEGEIEELRESLKARQRERERLRRSLAALAPKGRRAAASAKLAELGDVPLLRPEFMEELNRARGDLELARFAAKEQADELESIERSRGRLSAPEVLLEREADIQALRDRRGALLKARGDLPQREAEESAQRATARKLLERIYPNLPLEQAEQLLLTRRQKQALQSAVTAHAKLTTQIEDAEKRQGELDRSIRAAEAQLEGAEEPADVAPLRIAVGDLSDRQTLEDELRKQEGGCRKLRDKLLADLASLGRFAGSLEECRRLPLPGMEEIAEYDRLLEEAEDRVAELAKELKRAERERKKLDSEREKLLAEAGEVPTEQELVQSREIRDRLWGLVLQDWRTGEHEAAALQSLAAELGRAGEDLAETYAAGVATADSLADRLRREAARVSKFASLQVDLEQGEREIAELNGDKEQAEQELAARRAAWAELWRPLEIEPASPSAMRAWLNKLLGIRERIGELEAQERELEALREEIAAVRGRLSAELQSAGEPPLGEEESFKGGWKRGEQAVRRAEAARAEHQQRVRDLERSRREANEAREEVDRLRVELDQWNRDWAEVVAPLRLPAETPPGQAQEVLADLEDMFAAREEADRLQGRIADMRRDAEEFARDARQLAAACGIAEQDDPAETALAIERSLNDGLTAQKRLKQMAEEEADRRKKLAQQREKERLALASLNSLCKEAGCAAEEELHGCWRRSEERREHERSLKEAEEALIEQAGGKPLEEFLEELEQVDPDAIPGEIEGHEAEAEDLEDEIGSRQRELGEVEQQIKNLDTGAAAIEAEARARALLPQIAEQAAEYARLKLAAFTLRRAIDEFTKGSQQPMLQAANHWIDRLTAGSVTGLRVDYVDEKSDTRALFGVRPDGAKLPIAGMSEGTADQLYLALRLAYLDAVWLAEEHHEPLPFIVDDVLIKFDDTRAAAALRALAEFSRRTQVIVFTHHEHLLEIARENLEEGDWHELRLESLVDAE